MPGFPIHQIRFDLFECKQAWLKKYKKKNAKLLNNNDNALMKIDYN